MVTIALIGYGNLGQHLHAALEVLVDYKVTQICSPSQALETRNGVIYRASTNQLTPVDIYLIAVKDDVIESVSLQLPPDAFLVHTSGAQPLSIIAKQSRRGVLYPLQSFSRDTPVAFKQIPLFIEASNQQDLDVLMNLAKKLSDRVMPLDSKGRFQLQLGGVLVNNFVNHLYCQAADLLAQHQLPFDLLHPLIMETAQKVLRIDPKQAQTGPAKRKDLNTIEAHLAVLTDENQQEIYKLLSRSIGAYDDKKH
jgi:predicted short-subunit dehydrogenase-like oxidoreductase (DUF2520 family)